MTYPMHTSSIPVFRQMLGALKNVLAKSKGSSNPHNLVKATIAALCELRDAHSVAQLRGISMNQVFNG